jgi:hypothetical protein
MGMFTRPLPALEHRANTCRIRFLYITYSGENTFGNFETA